MRGLACCIAGKDVALSLQGRDKLLHHNGDGYPIRRNINPTGYNRLYICCDGVTHPPRSKSALVKSHMNAQ